MKLGFGVGVGAAEHAHPIGIGGGAGGADRGGDDFLEPRLKLRDQRFEFLDPLLKLARGQAMFLFGGF